MTGRKRTAAIQVRVTDREKRQMIQKARRAGLSLSELLRQTALERPAATTDAKTFRTLYAQADHLREPFSADDPVEFHYQLEELLRQILAAYTESEVNHGSDEDLADQG